MLDPRKSEFFQILDRGGTVRAAALQVRVSPDVGYNWIRRAGLSTPRGRPRAYSEEEKALFFLRLKETGNVSAVARELGFVRITCYKWAHQAGVFTGKSVRSQRDKFLKLRSEGMTRTQAMVQVGTDKRSAQDWDKGIRPFYGGRIYPDGRVVKYSTTERLANVQKPRTAHVHGEKVDLERLERPVSSRFLQLQERERLHDLRRRGNSIRAIARELGRAPSTISRELRRNTTSSLGYMPYGAHRAAATRRPRPRHSKLQTPGPLRDYVTSELARRRSPEQISHRLSKVFSNDATMRAATETIYQAIYSPRPGALRPAVTPVTRYGRLRRKPRRDVARRTTRFVHPMIPIALRPTEANDRTVPGHWEGDLIVGNLNKSAIGTLVERSSRYVMLVHLNNGRTAESVRDGLVHTMRDLPDSLRRTLTWDQGAEMSEHKSFTKATNIDVYFCDPASPWQRGSNENTNGLLRQYFPKGTDLARHSVEDLEFVADELNTRPRKGLDWETPAERLDALLALQRI
jgi:IS30 family transposase